MAKFLKERSVYLKDRSKQIESWRFICFGTILMSILISVGIIFYSYQFNKNAFVVLILIAILLIAFIVNMIEYVDTDRYLLKRIGNFLAGDTGEIEVEKVLGELPDTFVVIADLKKPYGGNIDFVVVGATGIFVLEVKNTKWHYSKFWKRDPVKQTLENATSLGNYLRKEFDDSHYFANPVLVFTSRQSVQKQGQVRIVSKDQLAGLLMEDNGVIWSSQKIEEVANKILKYG